MTSFFMLQQNCMSVFIYSVFIISIRSRPPLLNCVFNLAETQYFIDFIELVQFNNAGYKMWAVRSFLGSLSFQRFTGFFGFCAPWFVQMERFLMAAVCGVEAPSAGVKVIQSKSDRMTVNARAVSYKHGPQYNWKKLKAAEIFWHFEKLSSKSSQPQAVICLGKKEKMSNSC